MLLIRTFFVDWCQTKFSMLEHFSSGQMLGFFVCRFWGECALSKKSKNIQHVSTVTATMLLTRTQKVNSGLISINISDA